MINDYRLIGKENVVYHRYSLGGKYRMVVKSITDIYPGEELLVDYGYQYWFSGTSETNVKIVLSSLGSLQEQRQALKALYKQIQSCKKILKQHNAVKHLLRVAEDACTATDCREMAFELLKILNADNQFEMRKEERIKLEELLKTRFTVKNHQYDHKMIVIN